MIPAKKEISLEGKAEIIEELMRVRSPTPAKVSLKKFIDMYFQAFVKSGKTTREIYDFLKEKGVDVSSFQVFKVLYSRVKTSRKQQSADLTSARKPEILPTGSKERALPEPRAPMTPKPVQEEGSPDGRKTKVSKYNPALPPVFCREESRRLLTSPSPTKYLT